MKEMGAILRMGVHVYSPIVHCHELAKIAELPKEAGFWERYNFAMLERADTLWLLMLEGWAESKGCTAEIEEARRLRKAVIQFEPKETL